MQAIVLQSLCIFSAFAAISQFPPLVQTPVPPNIFFTLDDSGSMQWEAVPDAMVFAYSGFPMPTGLYQAGANPYPLVMGFGDGIGTSNTMHIDIAKYRSSKTNGLYYDPTITYIPWVSSAGTPMANATPTAALFNPIAPTGGVLMAPIDLTSSVQSAKWGNLNWTQYNGAPRQNEARNFYPATYFNYDTTLATCSPQSLNTLGCYTRVEIKSTVVTYPKVGGIATRSDCNATPPAAAAATCTYAQEIQNFANWFQYYRSRVLMARGGAGAAFAKQATNIRVGFGAINKSGTVVAGVTSDFSGANRASFFNNFYTHPMPASNTPLRQSMDQVGQYFSDKTINGPWQNIPGTGSAATDQYSCRQNYHIMMTDGYWNSSSAQSAIANNNIDGTAGSIMVSADGSKYKYDVNGATYTDKAGVSTTPIDKTFADSYKNVLADVAFYYWVNDLRPDWSPAKKNVPIASSGIDPAFWQHLVQYTVGVGVSGTLSTTDLPALKTGAKTWPDGSANQIDDLFHAAVNGHGQFYQANNPTQFADSLSNALNDIAARSGDAAAVGTSSNTVRLGTKIYISTYNTKDWSGALEQRSLLADGSVVAGHDWIIDYTTVWPAPASRKIFSYKDSSSKGVSFGFANLASSDQAFFTTAAAAIPFSGAVTGSDIVEYIKGDKTKEKLAGGVFRDRTNLLGDLVGSSPQYNAQGEDEGYSYLPSAEAASYFNFYSVIKKARAGRVFVGSNDGMLHAFNASDGSESFAYVPKTVMANLSSLANPVYSHNFYVNGTPTIADAYIGGWKTVLVGTTGAGGKGIFALDISNTSFSASDVLWEINSSNEIELGYTIGNPQVGKAPNGDWVAVFGNGYGSASQKAMLFIVNLANGAVTKINTNVGSSVSPNGLSTPRLVIDSNSMIQAAYAGDLQGNLWKFDFAAGGTTVAFSGSSLFQADPVNKKQPITTQPDLYPHPAGGFIVTFGTGKLFETGDSGVTDQQSIYGIWDKSGISGVTPTAVTGLSQLVQQTLSVPAANLVLLSNNTIDWTTKRGWYFNLDKNVGERVTTDPEVVYNEVAYTTVIPGSSTDPCVTDGKSSLIVFNPLTGGASTGNILDTNGDNKVDTTDTRVSGKTGALTFGQTILRGKNIKVYSVDSAGKLPKKQCNAQNVCTDTGENLNLTKIPSMRLWRQILRKD
ncbi:MAG: hypothetical protein H7252_01135 [Cytophaga sp.]|nr:hypothetical protein [Undibacterium sp.]